MSSPVIGKENLPIYVREIREILSTIKGTVSRDGSGGFWYDALDQCIVSKWPG